MDVATRWPALPSYRQWQPTCDTLHAHTQVLGKLSAILSPPQPQLQHAALRLTARGWETTPLPAPDGAGAFVVALNLHTHEAVIEHSSGAVTCVALTPNRSVGEITEAVLAAVRKLAGDFTIDLAPQEVSWTVALNHDEEHHIYDPDHVGAYFAAATQAALVLGEYRAMFRGRATPINAWWGSFDLAVSLFSGRRADPPAQDFIMRNSMDAEEIAIGWWPGDPRYDKPAFYAYAHPSPHGLEDAPLQAPAHWDPALHEFILDWDAIRTADDPHALAVDFARTIFRHACTMCDWDPELVATIDGTPPPVV